jgi:hypothetical protein
MIGLVPVVTSDYMLTLLYTIIIGIALYIQYDKGDGIFFVFGFLIMIIFEYLFITTGVETFTRNSLFSVMPLWLPFLWGYGFIAIKRAAKILDK